MPTYEYRCPDGHAFEKFQKMSDKPRAACPTCGKPATRQISGGAGLVFKGSGFYITDYGKDGKKDQRAAGGDKSASSSESGGSGSGDSKPAADKPSSATSSTPSTPSSSSSTSSTKPD